jgi:hypothetical protein
LLTKYTGEYSLQANIYGSIHRSVDLAGHCKPAATSADAYKAVAPPLPPPPVRPPAAEVKR